ncbi:MAG: flagellar motor protein MotD [Gammaproteobacteria bacterium]|nr:flagellar motor protein MotD [Gammaproteobacteria bacterium]
MARKHKHEEHENHERWLVSYADFITLLFAFFVVMYSVSSVNEGKYRVLSDSLTAAFRQPAQSMTAVPVGTESPAHAPGELPIPGSQSLIALPVPVQAAPDAREQEQEKIKREGKKLKPMDMPTFADPKMGEIADKITAALGGMIKDDLIKVRRNDRWLEVEIKSSILFPSGSARLTPAAYPMLEELAKILTPFPNPIHVEGFTDNIPIHSIAFLSNWELSAARAASVVHLFMQTGVEPERMAAIGYGEFKSVASNDTAEGRAKNRRVILVVMPGEDPRWARGSNNVSAIPVDALPAADSAPIVSAPGNSAPVEQAPADFIAPAAESASEPAAPPADDPFISPDAPAPQGTDTNGVAP